MAEKPHNLPRSVVTDVDFDETIRILHGQVPAVVHRALGGPWPAG